MEDVKNDLRQLKAKGCKEETIRINIYSKETLHSQDVSKVCLISITNSQSHLCHEALGEPVSPLALARDVSCKKS
jgi:hypothetical protein